MKSLTRFAFAAVLSLSAIAFTPATASAQTARGSFTLPHDVRWQNASVPAGEYQFTLDSKGPSQLMTLRRIDGNRVSFMLLVNDTISASSGNLDRLVLVPREGKTLVKSLELPYYGMTLNFAVPSAGTENEVALAGDHPDPTRTR